MCRHVREGLTKGKPAGGGRSSNPTSLSTSSIRPLDFISQVLLLLLLLLRLTATGSRVKIGFQAALKLLRAGAVVLATTRFPTDALLRFAACADFTQ